MKMNKKILVLLTALVAFSACREDDPVLEPEKEQVGEVIKSVPGFYVLNEGNMGSNKSTLDYYDYSKGEYTRNIYASINPDQPMELGDVGNDIAIYGSRLYAVINGSHKVEVMDAKTAKRIGQIKVNNCRSIAFHEGYAYVSSYAGAVEQITDYMQRGCVVKVDTATLAVVASCEVGYQPEDLKVVEGKLYVANSGGYVKGYDNTVSIIDLDSFKEVKRIDVAINLHHLCIDSHNQLWVSARGNYMDVPSRLYYVDLTTGQLADSINVGVSDFCLSGDSLYFYSNEWSNVTFTMVASYGIVNVAEHKLVSEGFITDGTEKDIMAPYSIKVNPLTKDILLTDARDYMTPGTLICYGSDGVKKWDVRTGDIPGHVVFVTEY